MTPDDAIPWPPPDAYRLDMLDDGDAWPEPVAPGGPPGATGGRLPPVGPGERWYSVEQAATLLGISPPTVRRRIKQGGPSFTLRDGSAWPVVSERIGRPQGSAFVVKLPAPLEPPSTEGPPMPDDDPTEPDNLVGTLSGVSDPSPASVTGASDASDPSSDASDRMLALVVAELAAARERVGELRALLAQAALELEASRRAGDASAAELARVIEAHDASEAAWALAHAELGVTLRNAEDRRLATEAALLALMAREDALVSRERDVAAREARASSPSLAWLSWWRRLLRLG